MTPGKMSVQAQAMQWAMLGLGLLGLIVVSVFTGLIAASGSAFLLLLFAAVVGSLIFIFLPIRWTLWSMFILAFLVVGNLRYFLSVGYVHWFPYLLGAGMLVQAALHAMFNRTQRRWPGYIVPLAAFLSVAVLSTALGDASAMLTFISAKNYFFMLSVILVFASGYVRQDDIRNLWRFLLFAAVLQAPFALYQYIFVAGHRAHAATVGDYAAWDAVVGTMGGNPDGGGGSQVMGYFLVVCVLLVLGLRQEKLIKFRWTLLVLLSALAAVLLAEVKATFLLLPGGLALLYWRQVTKRPAQTFLVMALAGGLLMAMPYAYDVLHYSQTSTVRSTQQMQEGLMEKLERQVNPEMYNFRSPILNRGALMYLWWGETAGKGDWQHALLGYGMGATHRSSFGVGEIARRLPYNIEETSTSVLLWETGILGLASYALTLLWAALSAFMLSKKPNFSGREIAYLRVTSVSLLMLVATLPYHSFGVGHFAGQLLSMFLLGMVAYYNREARLLAATDNRNRSTFGSR